MTADHRLFSPTSKSCVHNIMPEVTVSIDSTEFRLFVTREATLFRAFWFCPFGDCFGSFRSERLSGTREEALNMAKEAARKHHEESHQFVDEWYHAAMSAEDVPRLRIH